MGASITRVPALGAQAAVWLVLIAAVSGAQPVVTIDLATPPAGLVQRVYGATGTGAFGLPVAGGRDCDGDGFADVAVGYMTATALGRSGAGEVDLVFGDGTTTGWVDTAASDPRVLRFAGAAMSENAGSEVWIDDVTGDGLGDLLICRQNHTPDPSRIGAGALTIVAGAGELRQRAAELVTVDLASPPAGVTLTTLIGAAAFDRLGIWVRTGDVTGDGIADVVVGADQEDGPGEANRGAVYVIRGGAHLAAGGTVDLQDFGATALAGHLAKITPPPGATRYHLGATCQIGDLDGNGRAEVLAAATINRAGASLRAAGAPGGSAEASGGAPRGILYVAWDDNFPAGAWAPGYAFAIDLAPGTRSAIQGESVNHHFGEEILAGFDADGDGQLDLFAGDLIADGTPGLNRGISGLGHLLFDAAQLAGQTFDLDDPPPGLTITRILGPNAGAIGADTAAHGDFDLDGLSDLVFTSPHGRPQGRISAGVVHVLFGRDGGWPATVDLAPGNLPLPSELRIAEIDGGAGQVGGDRGDTLGYSATAGDLDGDGVPELILNEMVGNGIAPGTVDVGNLVAIGARAIAPALVFVDGFEGGSTVRWSAAVP